MAPHLVIAVANEGQIAAIGSEVPEDLAAELKLAVAGSALSPPNARPASIDAYEQLLNDSIGPVQLSSGPTYIVPPNIAFDSAADIVSSNDGGVERLRDRAPERAGWTPEEWAELIDGALGPWAFVVVEGRIVSICHSARLTDRGAEAGTWTDPDFRGQGHAAAVTAAWASLLAPSGRHLFYSTSADNTSSQGVAARLGLRPIGWMWQLRALEAL